MIEREKKLKSGRGDFVIKCDGRCPIPNSVRKAACPATIECQDTTYRAVSELAVRRGWRIHRVAACEMHYCPQCRGDRHA